MTENFHTSRCAGASQVNDVSRGLSLPVELEVFGEGSPRWLMVMATREALAIGVKKAIGKRAQGREALVMAARPDFLLPKPIEVFDDRLEAGFQRWGEYRSDTESQAQAHHPSNHIGMVMAALEANIVVELAKVGKPC